VVTSFTPRRCDTVKTDNAFEEGDWALHLAASPASANNGGGTISCGLSNGDVQVYDRQRLHNVATLKPDAPRLITDLAYGPETTVVAAGDDGSLVVYDLRKNDNESVALKGRLSVGQPALSASLGFDGYLAAVSTTKGRIHFLDLRSGGALLGSYVDSHNMDVTCVRFHPSNPSLLLSGAEDGLACVFDTTQPAEELALKSVLNVGTPIRRVGFCSVAPASRQQQRNAVWCLTGSETASLWDADTTSCIHDFGGLSLRDGLSQAASSGNGGNSRRLDYLIDAHFLADSQELLLSAGNAEGDAALFRLSQTTSPTAAATGQQLPAGHQQPSSPMGWEACHWLAGGHRGVVRATCLVSQSIVLTGGEDARLCEWNRLGVQAMTSPRSSPSGRQKPVVFAAGRGGGPMLSPSNGAARGVVGGGGPLRRQRQPRPSAAPY